jgi:hypothetical protein
LLVDLNFFYGAANEKILMSWACKFSCGWFSLGVFFFNFFNGALWRFASAA